MTVAQLVNAHFEEKGIQRPRHRFSTCKTCNEDLPLQQKNRLRRPAPSHSLRRAQHQRARHPPGSQRLEGSVGWFRSCIRNDPRLDSPRVLRMRSSRLHHWAREQSLGGCQPRAVLRAKEQAHRLQMASLRWNEDHMLGDQRQNIQPVDQKGQGSETAIQESICRH